PPSETTPPRSSRSAPSGDLLARLSTCAGAPLRVYSLPLQPRFAGMTGTGLLREHNEDSLLLLPEYGIVAVADGMGGHRSGDVASQLAISTLTDFFSIVVARDGTWPFPADPNLTDEENYVVTGLRLAN